MAEEIFEVVNERDEVVELRPRSEVHRLGLRHRAVHVLALNSRGQLFLQKRSMKKDCFPGVWDSSASGHLAPGEPYELCAVREAAEEIGLQLPVPPEPLFKIDACPATGMEFVWIYRCRAEGPFTLDPEEVADGGWFDLDELARWVESRPGDFAPSFVLIWNMTAGMLG